LGDCTFFLCSMYDCSLYFKTERFMVKEKDA
jgi:hypothetical protein